ncbi:MAG: hypothetical protein HZA53_01685 [Planctomycetes bacterium]|nr:hypothetical protein [Planctomycetota bacterium]
MVSKFVAASQSPTWNYSLPVTIPTPVGTGVHMSSDGGRCVAWAYDFNQARVFVAFLNESTGAPVSTASVLTLGAPVATSLSSDGNWFYVASANRHAVINANNGSTRYEAISFQPMSSAHLISRTGEIIGRGLTGGRFELLRWNGSTYSSWLTYDRGIADAGCAKAELAADDSTLALAWNRSSGYQSVDVELLRLNSSGSLNLEYQRTISSTVALQNVVKDLDLSDDGRMLAVGLSGDEGGAVPELTVYARDAQAGTWNVRMEQDLPGSVQDVDLSADGNFLVVASKGYHDNTLAGGGRVDYFSTTYRDMDTVGIPHSAGQVMITHQQVPGVSAILLASDRLANVPTVFDGIGTLYLSRSRTSAVGTATADGTGSVNFGVQLPSAPEFIGTTLHFQALCINPRRLSTDTVSILVLP